MQFDHSSTAKANILTVLDQHATEKYKMGQIFYVIFLRVEKKRENCVLFHNTTNIFKNMPNFCCLYLEYFFFLKCVAFYMILQIATKMYPIFGSEGFEGFEGSHSGSIIWMHRNNGFSTFGRENDFRFSYNFNFQG